MEKGVRVLGERYHLLLFLYPSYLLGLEESEVLVPGMERCSESGVISVFPLRRSNTYQQIKNSKIQKY